MRGLGAGELTRVPQGSESVHKRSQGVRTLSEGDSMREVES